MIYKTFEEWFTNWREFPDDGTALDVAAEEAWNARQDEIDEANRQKRMVLESDNLWISVQEEEINKLKADLRSIDEQSRRRLLENLELKEKVKELETIITQIGFESSEEGVHELCREALKNEQT